MRVEFFVLKPGENAVRIIIIWISCFFLLSACAFTDVTIDTPASSLENKVSGGNGRELVVLFPFADQRPNRARCGMQKNGYNMDTASALCQMEPSEWLSRKLIEELKASGFKVNTDRGPSKPSSVKIEGSLVQFFIEPVIGFWTITLETDIHIKLKATTANGLYADRSFYVKGNNTAMTGMASNFQPSVDEATNKVLKEMVSAILSLMNRYPELGFNYSSDWIPFAVEIVEKTS